MADATPLGLPPGLYDTLLTQGMEAAIALIPVDLVDSGVADSEEIHTAVARHISQLVERAIRALPEAGRLTGGVELANAIAEICGKAVVRDDHLVTGGRELREIREPRLGASRPRPEIPLSSNAILVNGPGEPRIGHELAREIASADHVDIIVAFLFWHGVRIVRDQLAQLVDRGGRVRVLTTVYAGASEQRALDSLVDLGADVRVSYDTGTTRLHAKAWLIERATGLSTAYVGSSNLSNSAQIEGLEWNVRLAQAESPSLIERFRTVFETYWASEQFETYDPGVFGREITRARGSRGDTYDDISPIHVHPFPHQRRILDDLDAERKRHGRFKNLVVAATGTGKTVVAALDYRRLREELASEGIRDASVLFVAHREEILRQSRATFRQVLARGDFGEQLVGGARPDAWNHVFASIQSLAHLDLERMAPDHFAVVIVDEFHHAAAPTYRRLLEHVQPRVLLGLTATPERTDGVSVLHWFDDHVASELRLWDAIDGGMLCPFQYFGVHDDVDLAELEWRRGGYDEAQISNLFTGNDARAAKVVRSVRDIADHHQMRAIGFCVSVDHAHYMARYFDAHGIAARALDAGTPRHERRATLDQLERGEIRVVFAVDLLNEGVDLPRVDTVLFLRPTESATVFLQQLGRGLRRVESKACLTVLDFIGNQHRRFRFDLRYRALTGASRSDLVRHAAEGFPFLPSGCHIELDRVVSQIVLENIRQQIQRPRRELVSDLKSLGDVPLRRFLEETQAELPDIYPSSGPQGWASLRRAAGLPVPPPGPAEVELARAIGRLLHVSDRERIGAWREWVSQSVPPEVATLDQRRVRLLGMLLATIDPGKKGTDAATALSRLWSHEAILDELAEVLEQLDADAQVVTYPLHLPHAPDVPLQAHARYTRREILAAFGHSIFTRPLEWREGVRFDQAAQADIFAFTLRKAERDFSPSTMYHDYAISRDLVHWESQSTLTRQAATARRYIDHREQGTSVLLFARGTKHERAFTCLGTASHVNHRGERPIAFDWKLDRPMPEAFFAIARAEVA